MSRSILVLALSSAGCLSPPLRAGVGGGGGIGTIATVDPSRQLHLHDSAGLGELRAGVTPLEFGDHAPDGWDLSIGAILDRFDAPYSRGSVAVGPYVEGVWFAHASVNGNERWRIGPTAAIDVLLDAPPASGGVGVAGGVLLETDERVDGPIFLGGARGELGIGISLRAGVRDVDANSYAFALLSIEIRVPGIAALPIPAPTSSRLNY